MTVPRSMGWAVAIVSVLVALVLLSFLALDKPNVVWRGGVPHCPHCRTQVAAYATRCQACREPFDWVTASEEDSPYCTRCLSAAEDEALRALRQGLGDDRAAQAVAEVLEVAPPVGKEYLLAVGRGQCGWCGGVGRDLSATGDRVPCPACGGTGRCASCDGDRRIRLGLESAGVEMDRYRQLAASLFSDTTPVGAARKVLQESNATFLRRFAGTAEVAQLYFAPQFRSGTSTPLRSPFLVAAARGRLDAVLAKLAHP